MNRHLTTIITTLLMTLTGSGQTFQLTPDGYFTAGGTDVMDGGRFVAAVTPVNYCLC